MSAVLKKIVYISTSMPIQCLNFVGTLYINSIYIFINSNPWLFIIRLVDFEILVYTFH